MEYIFPRFPEGKFKAVTFSYDDACKSDLRLAKVLDSYGIKCTFNISSSFLGREDRLTVNEIKDNILPTGHEIAIHGKNHKAPGLCRSVEYIRDILDCRTELEGELSQIVKGFAYPDSGILLFEHGNSYEKIKQTLKDLGIKYARTIFGDNDGFYLPDDWYNWKPTVHHANPKAKEYAEKFKSLSLENTLFSDRQARLFYLWGHSFEYDNNKNWELLDELCKILAGDSNIWYATNMEIYDYMAAYESLEFSADNKIIYNPSLFEVWLEIDRKLYSIKSGETLKI